MRKAVVINVITMIMYGSMDKSPWVGFFKTEGRCDGVKAVVKKMQKHYFAFYCLPFLSRYFILWYVVLWHVVLWHVVFCFAFTTPTLFHLHLFRSPPLSFSTYWTSFSLLIHLLKYLASSRHPPKWQSMNPLCR